MAIKTALLRFLLFLGIGAKEEALQAYVSALVVETSIRYELDPKIVAAIIYQESVKGSETLLDAICASREERGFYRLYIAGKPLTGFVPKKGLPPSEDTERRERSFSYGLMQVMGATARENGLTSQYIGMLMFPNINIEIGCRYFAKLLKEEGGNIREALRRYNGLPPGDYTYANLILSHVESGRYQAVLIGV